MKLHADLSKRVVVDTNEGDWIADEIEGVFHMPLHADGDEQVRLTKMDPGCTVPSHEHASVQEILVLEGTLEDEDGVYPNGTWLRLPAGSRHAPKSAEGCLLLAKQGHLK